MRIVTSLHVCSCPLRFIPPSSICPSGVRKKNTLPKEAKQVLTAWLDKNFNDPFPNRNTKDSLAHQSGLTRAQASFIATSCRCKSSETMDFIHGPSYRKHPGGWDGGTRHSLDGSLALFQTRHVDPTSDQSALKPHPKGWHNPIWSFEGSTPHVGRGGHKQLKQPFR